MTDSDFLGTGWRFPFTMNDGSMQLASGEESIRESILLILRTNPGERLLRPEFGCDLSSFVFAENNTTTATLIAKTVKQALLAGEPRIIVNGVNVYPDDLDYSYLNIEIDYTIRTSNLRTNVVFPFYLENK